MGALAALLRALPAADPESVARMLRSASHRGDTVRIRTIGRCSVGILSRNGEEDAQIAIRNGLAVALCGIVDNADSLSARLGSPAGSTADVILKGFQAYGESVLNDLRGTYSGVITDGTSMLGFRDHIGFGLLHYAEHEDDIYIATEAKMILAGSGLAREPEPKFLEDMLYNWFEDQTLCALKGLRRLPQGSVLTAATGVVRWSRYWHPDQLLEGSRMRPGEVQARFDELMTRAVSRVLTGQDAIALSGGIDSPALAAYAGPEHLRLFGRPLPAISAVYPEFPTLDERPAIELVADRLGLDLHLFTPRAGPLDRLRDRVKRSDGPAPSSFAQPREMYLLARELGFRTLLNGNYAELLVDAGQPYLVAHLLRAGRLGAIRTMFGRQKARGVPTSAIGRQLARALVPPAVLDLYDRGRQKSALPDWLDQRRLLRYVPNQVPGGGRWQQAHLASFFMPRLAVEADEIEQASLGVRVRWPWADVDLWKFFLELPAEIKYPDLQPRKLLVRQLLRGKVPDTILDRREKTVVDDAGMRWLDYDFLRQLLTDPPASIAGVDYLRLAEHLRRQDLPARDFRYVRNLAAIHVFLEEWQPRRN